MANILIASIFAFGFSVAAYYPYIKSVRFSARKPTISSWIAWFLMDAAISAQMFMAGVMAWQMLAYTLGSVLVIYYAIRRGATLGWKPLDIVCVAFVVASLALWFWTGSPEVGIYVNIAAAVVSTIPILANTWEDASNEPFLPWVLIAIGGMFGVVAAKEYTFAGVGPQAVFLLLQVSMLAVILRTTEFRQVKRERAWT